MNTLSDFAANLMRKGFLADSGLPVYIPDYGTLRQIAKEVFDVPEKPERFDPWLAHLSQEKCDIAVLVSGGLDSTVAWLRATEMMGHYPDAYYVDIGMPYSEKEKQALRDIGIPFEIIQGERFDLDKSWKHIQPGRNFYYLCLVAERLTNGGEIWLGALDGEMPVRGGDKSKAFFRLVNTLFAKKLPWPVVVRTPLAKETKTDLLTWAKEKGLVDTLRKTISCFSEEKGRCGRCQTCLRIWMAFYYNDLEIDFNVDPMIGCQEYIGKYKRVMEEALSRKDFSHYSRRRCLQDLGAIYRREKGKG